DPSREPSMPSPKPSGSDISEPRGYSDGAGPSEEVMDEVTRVLTNQEKATLAPVSVDEVSTKIIAAIDVIASLIPDLRTPHPRTEKKLRGGRTVPREAVLAIIALVESSSVIRSMNL